MPPNIPQKDGERSELWSGFNRETCRGSFRLYEAVLLVGEEVHLIISFSVHDCILCCTRARQGAVLL